MPAIEVMIKSCYWTGKLANRMKQTFIRWVYAMYASEKWGTQPIQIAQEVFSQLGKQGIRQ